MSLQLCDSRSMSSGGYISSSQVNLTRAIILWALQTPARPLWWIGKTFLLWRLGAYTSNPGVAPSSPLPTASLVLQCWSSYTASSNLFSKIVATHNTIHQDLMMALVEGHLWQSILTWVFHKLKPENSGHPRKAERDSDCAKRNTSFRCVEYGWWTVRHGRQWCQFQARYKLGHCFLYVDFSLSMYVYDHEVV